MKLALEGLALGQLLLELPAPSGPPDLVDIAGATGVRGGYEQDATTIRLAAIAGEALDLARIALRLGGLGRLEVGGASLREVGIDAAIALGDLAGRRRFSGRVAIASGDAAHAGIDLGALHVGGAIGFQALEHVAGRERDGGTVSAARLDLRSLRLESGGTPAVFERVALAAMRAAWSDRGELALEGGSLAISGITAELRGARVAAAALRCAAVHVKRSKGGALEVELANIEVDGLELEAGGARVRIDRAAMPGRTRWAGGALSFDELAIVSAEVVVDLAAALPNAASSPSTSSPPATAPPVRRLSPRVDPRTDWSFLDGIDGQFDVDVVVDVKGLLVFRRVATHRLRIAIEAGILNYRELERDLSFLEDMILDFAVRDGELVFEKKVPLVPVGGVPLCTWPLDLDAQKLAARHLVRLRTLLGWHVAESAPAWPGLAAFKFEVTKLEFERIAARLKLASHGQLALGETGIVRLGAPGRAALEALRIDGSVHHRGAGITPPTEVRVAVEALLVGLDGLRVGTVRVDAGEIAVRALDQATVVFHGVRPASLRCTLRDLDIRAFAVGVAGA